MRLWVLTLLLLAPAASAEATEAAAPLDLYVHLGRWQDFPVNTQVPQSTAGQHTSVGLGAHSGCVPDMGQASLLSRSVHTWYAFHSPGFVEYEADEEQPRIHVARGLGTDLHIDGGVQPVMTWNLAAKGPADALDAAAQVIPQVVLRVEVRASDELDMGHNAIDEAEVVASGEAGPVTLRPGVKHEAVTEHEIDGRKVYRFAVPLSLHNTTIARDDGFSFRIQAEVDDPLCSSISDGYVMPDLVQPFQADGLWNHLRLAIEDPLALEAMHIVLLEDELVVHTSFTSPFGGYDVVSAGGLVVHGPGALLITEHDPTPRFHQHGDAQLYRHDPSWVIQTKYAQPGLYTVDLKATNLQGTANATITATFEIGDHGTRICQPVEHGHACTLHAAQRAEIPGAPLVWLLGALVLLRRR